MSALETDLQQLAPKLRAVTDEVRRTVVGQEHMVNRLLVGLLTGGHVLLEGVPGLAKTLTVSTLAKALDLDFSRVQFTPDLLPSDVLGTLMYNPKEAKFETRRGPVFANVVLADEINRAPAKVQSALLEAMQEKQVTLGETTHPLPKPFLVLATQNPVDQEGTYPLPEAQVDRFMLKVQVTYPSKQDEIEIMRRMATTADPVPTKSQMTKADILKFRALVGQVEVQDRLLQYIAELVNVTRDPVAAGLPKLKDYIEFGASPRASISMVLGAKALAAMAGRAYALPEDVKAIAPDVLNHRMVLTFEAEADGLTGRAIAQQVLNHVAI